MKARHAVTATLPALLLPMLAWAHPGHDVQSGFAAGAMHPLSGLDHLAAMLAVGAWAAQLKGQLRLVLPASFVVLMLVGALLGASGIHIGAVEQGIAASVCVLGLLLTGTVQLPITASLLISGFALFHGYAHGVEAPQQANFVAYLGGFALTTIVLHVTGYAACRALVRHQQHATMRWIGAAMAVGGLALFAG